MADRLQVLLERFQPAARLTHAGLLVRPALPGHEPSGTPAGDAQARNARTAEGLLVLVRRGAVQVETARTDLPRRQITQPGLLWVPHSAGSVALQAMTVEGVQLLAARLQMGRPELNPLLRSLPASLQIHATDLGPLQGIWTALWEELLGQGCAHQAVLSRLMEVLVVQLLRGQVHRGDHETPPEGLIAGLADPRLARVLDAVHQRPQAPWTLETMADVAGMSRARFAARFKALLGQAPADYLTQWRLGVAQTLLREGRAIHDVASAVGYASPAAFARVFRQRLGTSPTAWLGRQLDPRRLRAP